MQGVKMNQTLSNKQRKKQELRTEANAIISLLAERFPDCFTLHAAKRRPLKINIGADILAALNGAIPRQELGRALSFYTGNAIYLSRMHPGTARIDLAGNKAGEVTAEHAAQAKERLTAGHQGRGKRRNQNRRHQSASRSPICVRLAQGGARLGSRHERRSSHCRAANVRPVREKRPLCR
jgi:sRNA-binding protein